MRSLFVALTVCLAGAGAYGLWLLLELRAATAPPTPTAFVQATWSVYRFGPGHRLHVGQLSLDCQACHQAEDGGRFDRPGPSACTSCHEARAGILHALVDVDESGHRAPADAGADRITDCIACHGFGPDPDAQAKDCLSCHEHARGHTPAIVTHADVACETCHEVHDNRVTPLKCLTCHSIEAQHGHTEQTPEQTCLTCHRVHDRAAPALEGCRACHTPEAGSRLAGQSSAPAIPSSASFDGHSCTGCHAPHTFAKDRVAACTTCHADMHALEGKGHTSCTACHAPHAARESVAENVCLHCHKDVALVHTPTIDPASACTSCHAPHPSERALQHTTSQHTGAASCVSCHQDVGRAGQHAHAGDMACTSCHKPHAFALPEPQKACNACHAAEATRVQMNPGHASCAGCHQNLPHGADLAAKQCTSCHADVHAQQGHSRCTNCHEPHQGAQNGKACADCHAEQAHAGIHNPRALPCTQCHDQHTTTLAAGVADCRGCHVLAKLPGLHEVPQHAAACTSCHVPHGTDLPGARAACLACHQDRKDHQPEAKRCEGCHQFVPAAQGARRAP